MSKPIAELQGVELLQMLMDEIPNHKVYFTMKEMKLRGLRETTVNFMRACLAIHSSGLPITTNILAAVLNRDNPYGLISALHNLGDKNCLVLKRGHGWGTEGGYEWVVHPLFLKYFYGDEK